MAMPGAGRSQAQTHELVTLKFLFTAQTADDPVVGIVVDTTRYFDGWFHHYLVNPDCGSWPD